MAQSRTIKVLALSTGHGLTVLVSLVAAAVLTRVLTVRDYATYRQTFLAYQFAAPLLTLALPMALYYFLPGESKRRRGVLFDNLAALTLMGCVFAIFLLAGGNRLLAWRFNNPDIVEPLRWMAIYALFALPAGALGACLTVQNRVMQLSAFNFASRALTLAAIIITGLVWQNPFAPIKAAVVCEGLVLAGALWLMIRSVPPDEAGVRLSGMVAMAKYAVPLGLASVLGTLTLQLGNVIVASMCTPEQFAVYANGAIEIPLIGIITGSIAVVILADMRQALVRGEPAAALSLFRTAASKSACILLPAMCFLFIFAEDTITLLYSDKYMGSVLPFRIYLLILPVRIIYYGSALMALGLSKVVLIRSVFDLLTNLVLSIPLIHMIGPIGAAVATLLMLYVWHVPFNLYQIGKGFHCRMTDPLPFADIGRTLLAALLAGCLALPVLALPNLHASVRLMAGLAVFAPAYLACGRFLHAEVWVLSVQVMRIRSDRIRPRLRQPTAAIRFGHRGDPATGSAGRSEE